MIGSLMTMYRKGAITADEVVVQSLHMVDSDDPGLVLGALPEEILTRVLEFVRSYQPNEVITNYGPLPSEDRIKAARRWIESARDPVASRRGLTPQV